MSDASAPAFSKFFALRRPGICDPPLLSLSRCRNASIAKFLLLVCSERAALPLLNISFCTTCMISGVSRESSRGLSFSRNLVSQPFRLFWSPTSLSSFFLQSREENTFWRTKFSSIVLSLASFQSSCFVLRVTQTGPAPTALFVVFGGIVKQVLGDFPVLSQTPTTGFTATILIKNFKNIKDMGLSRDNQALTFVYQAYAHSLERFYLSLTWPLLFIVLNAEYLIRILLCLAPCFTTYKLPLQDKLCFLTLSACSGTGLYIFVLIGHYIDGLTAFLHRM